MIVLMNPNQMKTMEKRKFSKVDIVLGLLFGDEGKGRTMDSLFLTNKNMGSSRICVRFSGGHQVGHTVMINGVGKHVFSNYGSGTLRGIPTYYSEYCTIYYPTMISEGLKLLGSFGIKPIVYVHPLTMIATVYDLAYNRALEYDRGVSKHGSVGVGFGSTVSRNLNTPYKLYAIDAQNSKIFKEKNNAIKSYYDILLGSSSQFLRHKYHLILDELEYDYLDSLNILPFTIKPYEFLKNYQYLGFEGSQGIMLDETHGIYPNVTYSSTTSKNALEICRKLGIDDEFINIYYVTRCYTTRHGMGWMPNKSKIKLINTEEETCKDNKHQGPLRIGKFCYETINHSLMIDDIYSNGIGKNLVVTCMDQRPKFDLDSGRLNTIFRKIILFNKPYNEKE